MVEHWGYLALGIVVGILAGPFCWATCYLVVEKFKRWYLDRMVNRMIWP